MDILGSVLKMSGALLVVFGGIVVTAYLAKRFIYPRLGVKSAPIRIVATSYLGPKKQISVVEIAGVYLVVGITPHQISLLTQLEEFPLNVGGPA